MKDMKEAWKVTWKDMAAEGFRESLIGTKYLRFIANEIGAYSPDREWQWSKDLYVQAARLYGRSDWRSVEKACRTAIAAAGLKATPIQVAYDFAEIAWERREALGIQDKEGWYF